MPRQSSKPARKALLAGVTINQLMLVDDFLAEREAEQIEELVGHSDPVQYQARVKEVREIRELLKRRSVAEEAAE